MDAIHSYPGSGMSSPPGRTLGEWLLDSLVRMMVLGMYWLLLGAMVAAYVWHLVVTVLRFLSHLDESPKSADASNSWQAVPCRSRSSS